MPEIINGVEVDDIQLTDMHYTMPKEVIEEVNKKVHELYVMCERLKLPALCVVQTINHPDTYATVDIMSHHDGRGAYPMSILMGAYVVLTDSDYTVDDRLALLKAIADIQRKHNKKGNSTNGNADVGTH